MFSGVELFVVMILGLSLAAPLTAQAVPEQCSTTCHLYRSCSEDALRTMNDESYDALTCSSYRECEYTVQVCREQAGACANECAANDGG